MITIQGFTGLQREIADRIWSMDTEQQVQDYIQGMPRKMQTQARIVLAMIIAHELDSHMEVSDEVQEYLRSR